VLSWLLRKGMREGLRRGVAGGERVWLVLGAAALLARLALRVLHQKPEVVFKEKLRPGEQVVITHRPRTRPS
jgi:hypothetical protein